MKLILRRYWWVILAPAMPLVAMYVNHTIVLTNRQRLLLAAGCVILTIVIAVMMLRSINRAYVESERSRRSRESMRRAVKERLR